MIKVVVHDQDDFLVTAKNIAIFKARLARCGAVVRSFVQRGNSLEIELEGTVTQDIVNQIADYWEGSLWGEPEPDYEAVAMELYTILDDIDTLSDIYKSDDRGYRAAVNVLLQRRKHFCTTDGYNVVFSTPPAHYCDGGCCK